ncbi:MAG: hypothetical protein ACR2NZ_06730 [Rubripirellula sp.]
MRPERLNDATAGASGSGDVLAALLGDVLAALLGDVANNAKKLSPLVRTASRSNHTTLPV